MLMTYDYHELSHASLNAPLNREGNQNAVITETVADNVAKILQQGCGAEKLVLGIPTYGRTYSLKDASKNHIGAPVEGLGEPGPYTLSSGSLGFNEVRKVLTFNRLRYRIMLIADLYDCESWELYGKTLP